MGGTLKPNEALKRLLERPRPALDWAEAGTGVGFPSGYAMNSTVVLGALALIAWRLRGPWVSWNGSTEVAEWELLAGDDEASLSPVERVPGNRFEADIAVPGGASVVAVRALDAAGDPLATSLPVPVEAEVPPPGCASWIRASTFVGLDRP